MKACIGLTFSFAVVFSLISCGQENVKVKYQPARKDLSNLSKATFASGCFWCVEGVFESVIGVEQAISGYAGGKEANPTYEQVGAHETGHVETVEVYYDPSIVSYETLLKVYFASQNPTQVDGQGPDHGSPYRSIIFYRTPEEKLQAEKYIKEIQKNFSKPIAAKLVPFERFWPAEDYHQDYIQHNPGIPYVQHESIPRIKKFQKQFPSLIKPGYQY